MQPEISEIIPLAEYIFDTLRTNLSAMSAEIDGVFENSDIEFIHRIRVFIRRYRNNLQIFQRFGTDSISELLQVYTLQTDQLAILLATARDLDIQQLLAITYFQSTNLPGTEIIISQLQSQRQAVQNQLVAVFTDNNLREVFNEAERSLAEIILAPSRNFLFSDETIPLRAICSTTAQAIAMLYALNEHATYEQIHRFRKIIRRLRYTLESYQTRFAFPLIPIIETCHQIQDLLGDMHDLDTLHLFITQTEVLHPSESRDLITIIDHAREPLQNFFSRACHSGEIMHFLQTILNLFNQELIKISGNNPYENSSHR